MEARPDAAEKMCEDVEVAIVGAGIAGLATALALQRVGAKRVVVMERATGLRSTGTAIFLFPNAWRALAALGVAPKLDPFYPQSQRNRVTNIATGDTQEVTFGGDPNSEGTGLRLVHRRVLLESLAEELSPGTVRFSSEITSIETESAEDVTSGIVLHLDDGTVIRAKVLIGCDGVHSSVAHWLGLSIPVDAGRAVVRGLAVYPDGHGLNREYQQLFGKNVSTAVCTMNDKEIFWFVTKRGPKPSDRGIGRDPELTLKHVTETLAKDFPRSFLDVVHRTDHSTLSWTPLTLRLPWHVLLGKAHKGNVTVAGDAFHPMTPDLGQGGCAALEDAVVLGRNLAACLHLDGSVDSQKAAGCLAKFVAERRWRGAMLVAASYVSGWVEKGGSGWWDPAVKFFNRFLIPKMVSAIVDYDCGSLPTACSSPDQ